MTTDVQFVRNYIMMEHEKLISKLESTYLNHINQILKQKASIHQKMQQMLYSKLLELNNTKQATIDTITTDTKTPIIQHIPSYLGGLININNIDNDDDNDNDNDDDDIGMNDIDHRVENNNNYKIDAQLTQSDDKFNDKCNDNKKTLTSSLEINDKMSDKSNDKSNDESNDNSNDTLSDTNNHHIDMEMSDINQMTLENDTNCTVSNDTSNDILNDDDKSNEKANDKSNEIEMDNKNHNIGDKHKSNDKTNDKSKDINNNNSNNGDIDATMNDMNIQKTVENNTSSMNIFSDQIPKQNDTRSNIVNKIDIQNNRINSSQKTKKKIKIKRPTFNTLSEEKKKKVITENDKKVITENHKKAAEMLKNEGNKLLGKKKYNEAVMKYTEAISLNATNAIYFSNRAAAQTHLKQYHQAVIDSQMASKIDPNYVKAYVRQGFAHYKLSDFKQAHDAYSKALNLTKPTDKEYKIYLQQIKLCEKKLSNNVDIRDQKRFNCTECDKSFKMKAHLSRHIKSHKGIINQTKEENIKKHGPYICTSCGKTFKLKQGLKNHVINMHTKNTNKPYKCSECDYGAATKGSLQQHQRTHTGEKQFCCNICFKKFRYRCNLTKHISSHHTE